MASTKIDNFLKKAKLPPRKFEYFTASGRLENTFSHILHDLGYILHSPKPLLFVLCHAVDVAYLGLGGKQDGNYLGAILRGKRLE